jgi:hypothetical protein
VYTPGITPVNTNTPLESVVVVAKMVPLAPRSSTMTPPIGVSPIEPFFVSSNTTPLMVRVGSSTKSFAVEFSPEPRTTRMALSLAPEMSETDT